MTVIVAKYVNHAKPDKKFGSIIDPNGAKFMLPVGMQDAFVAGQTYDVPTSNKKWGQDAVVVIEGRPGAAGSTHPATPAPTPQTSPAGHNSGRMTNYDDKDALIFITGVVGRSMGSGSFGATDIKLLTLAAIEAWDAVRSRKA